MAGPRVNKETLELLSGASFVMAEIICHLEPEQRDALVQRLQAHAQHPSLTPQLTYCAGVVTALVRRRLETAAITPAPSPGA